MLIHVIPQIHIPRHLGPLDVRLLTIGIPEIGWQRNEEALRVGRPYPNKGYIIGYAAARTRAAVVGLFVETPDFVDRYTVIARWGIAGGVNGDITVTHTVEHTVLDTEYDAVSDLMLLWYGNDTRPSRYPDLYADNPPVLIQPVMDLLLDSEGGTRRGGDSQDKLGPDGLIVERRERFSLPTLERARFAAPFAFALGVRFPSLVDTPKERLHGFN